MVHRSLRSIITAIFHLGRCFRNTLARAIEPNQLPGPGPVTVIARIDAMITTPRIVRPRLRESGRRDGVIRGVSFHIKRIMRAPARSLKQSAMRGMRFGKGIILVGGCLSFFLLLFFPLSSLSLSLSLSSPFSPTLLSLLLRVVFIAWRVLAERSYLRIS